MWIYTALTFSEALIYGPCVTRSHSFSCHRNMNHRQLLPSRKASSPFGWYSLRLPTKGWPGWVVLKNIKDTKNFISRCCDCMILKYHSSLSPFDVWHNIDVGWSLSNCVSILHEAPYIHLCLYLSQSMKPIRRYAMKHGRRIITTDATNVRQFIERCLRKTGNELKCRLMRKPRNTRKLNRQSNSAKSC